MKDSSLKALFLDRDGVINKEKNYLYKIHDFEFMEGVLDLCKYYQELGYIIIVITNQSGISRGYYTQDDFNLLTKWMNQEFYNSGIKISHVYSCPHHPDISGYCLCRKPNPGMLLEAQKDYNIDMNNSLMIGDKESDVLAAINAGVKETYLLDITQSINKSKATRIVNKLDDIWKK